MGSLGTIWGGYLLYKQNKVQEKKYIVDKYRQEIKELTFLLNSFHYKNHFGSEAIIKYSINYETEKNNHPRFVLDKLIYLTKTIDDLLIHIYSDWIYLGKETTNQLLLEVLSFNYYNLYFPISFKREDDLTKKGLIYNIENEKYAIFINRISELLILTYHVLSKKNIIDKHDESEKGVQFFINKITSPHLVKLQSFLLK
jgi:hypothetical protein